MIRQIITAFSVLILSLLCSACARLNPEVIQASGVDYNIAVQRTSSEQMLLNLVRLKYRDVPFFLEVGSVSSQFKLSSGASLSANFKEQQIPENIGFGANINFIEQPTITYTPLGGDKFVQRLLTPISVDNILLLVNSGWSIERVLRLCVQEFNGIPNAPSASGPTPKSAPPYRDFIRLTSILRKMQKNGAIALGQINTADGPRPALVIDAAKNDALAQEFKNLASLVKNTNQYWLNAGSGAIANSDSITINARSLMGLMYYLSQSVIIPQRDKDAGVVTITRDESGAEFDWTDLTKNLFKIESAEHSPEGHNVRTHYRGTWFYIDDKDLDSKSTFAILTQLFSLQAGKAEGLTPVLTLPLGQ